MSFLQITRSAWGSFVLYVFILIGVVRLEAHEHYAAGIVDANHNGQADAGEALQFVGENGTGRTFHLLPRPAGQRPTVRCGGFYALDEQPRTLFPTEAFSFTALSDGQYEVASPLHAHTGAYLWLEITAVSGPAGGHLGFWNENASFFFDAPSVSFATGQPTGNYRLVLSEGIDEVTEDPFGHIHGRSWTADKAGDYYLSVRLVDLSTTGPGGGPWHTPSQTYVYHFKAGPDFQPTGQVVGNSYVLTWASQMGISNTQTGMVFQVERSTTLAANSWQNVGTVTGTTADTVIFTDNSPPAGRAFYRLKYAWGPP
jgi:hypothetical protein